MHGCFYKSLSVLCLGLKYLTSRGPTNFLPIGHWHQTNHLKEGILTPKIINMMSLILSSTILFKFLIRKDKYIYYSILYYIIFE